MNIQDLLDDIRYAQYTLYKSVVRERFWLCKSLIKEQSADFKAFEEVVGISLKQSWN